VVRIKAISQSRFVRGCRPGGCRKGVFRAGVFHAGVEMARRTDQNPGHIVGQSGQEVDRAACIDREGAGWVRFDLCNRNQCSKMNDQSTRPESSIIAYVAA